MRPSHSRLRTSVTVCASFLAGLAVNAALSGADGPRTTPAAMRAIAEMFPGGRIDEVEFERHIVELYDIAVIAGDRVVEASVMPDGTVLNVEQEIDPKDAPESVAAVIERLAAKGEVNELERVEVHGELRAVKFDKPRIEYEAEVEIGGKTRLVRLTENGEPVRNGEDPRADDD